ncbi:NUDIX domain-containing protein [Parasalinivibrio latis]|uniref:NUDIX hydrolase n=1 Tax=Parasalinivibrio latis TaxID=2952610 RepID=UPI0030E50976
MEVHECVSFLLVSEGRVLLEKRSMAKKNDPGLNAIPGGHMEPGENQEQTLIRELREELDLEPVSFGYLCSLYHPTDELQLIHYYVVSAWAGDLRVLEADEVIWHRIEDVPLDLAADRTALGEYRRLVMSGKVRI